MTKNKNSELSIYELTEKIKQQKRIFKVFLGFYIGATIAIIGLFIWKGSKIPIATVTPIPILMITLLPIYTSIKEIEKELDTRKSK